MFWLFEVAGLIFDDFGAGVDGLDDVRAEGFLSDGDAVGRDLKGALGLVGCVAGVDERCEV